MILAAGAAIQVLTGVPAAWGVFQRGVCEGYSLSQENAAMIFSLTICFFRHWVYLGRPFTGQKRGRARPGLQARCCWRRASAARGFIRGKSVVLLRCVQRACGAGLCVFVSFGHVLRAEVVCGPQRAATGVIGGAVGASGAVLTFLGRFLIGTWSIRTAFWVLGLLMLAVCGAGAAILENPEQPPGKQRSRSAAEGRHQKGRGTTA